MLQKQCILQVDVHPDQEGFDFAKNSFKCLHLRHLKQSQSVCVCMCVCVQARAGVCVCTECGNSCVNVLC